jgi:hypothetical protein
MRSAPCGWVDQELNRTRIESDPAAASPADNVEPNSPTLPVVTLELLTLGAGMPRQDFGAGAEAPMFASEVLA